MSVNSEKPHILIVPEDDENRQVANGFFEYGSGIKRDCHRIMPLAGGWLKAFNSVKKEYRNQLEKYSECRLLLLIDFDHKLDRLEKNKHKIPAHLQDRVFVIGIRSKKPKDLAKVARKNLEALGELLAGDCANGKPSGLWEHDLLKHNEAELQRLCLSVRSFLFDDD